MRIIMREDGKFVKAENREEISAIQLLNLVRGGEKVRVESEKTGEDVTGEALTEALHKAEPTGDFVEWLNHSYRDFKSSVSSRGENFEDTFKNWLGKIKAEYGGSRVEEWYLEGKEETVNVEERLMQFIQSALEKIGVPHKDKIVELEERIEKLEKKIKR